MSKRVADLKVRLPGFVEPSTASQREGFLEPGRYTVLDYRTDHPDENSDYALVSAPVLGASDTWICTRWKGQRYADISEQPRTSTERRSFEDDPRALPEQALVDLLPRFHDFTYDLDEARYPFELPGVRIPVAPPATNNCCTFVEALLVRAWADATDLEWDAERHGQMMIFSADDFYSPVTAAVETELALPVSEPDAPPHPWTIVQGWRHQWRGGHTFLIVDHHAETDRVLTLESNSSYNLDGVGFRKIGNLRDLEGRPPENWWERDDLWTWEKVCSTYRFRNQAWLKVTDRGWSGL
ncbi:MAG: hypothetical protein GWN99_13275 [Gemmatimonadetes bacterium]|uniref:Uncharacterized protein n=1 Tax=Candidatus Kutchimonas denitrificans TaxID=3056748 RepID=A0AAE4ZCC2_9BACT|nr:hypothetical protein [Gemmatimonadota bacterium]NIR75851.1 hypothetical protein [Candidatus Kutchimonas denitrificans]NIS02018.1 hypothetical protein [Gemmatimonadota bacterium]NIT67822.1 hypothetical protein [Gemmatimonadota bacterium]NIU53809.1 hypothetical protein [Gemmatimonadota bacterium]